MIERDLNVPFVAELALREKQIQQNYRPVIAVHKWFARRPGSLFRALLLAEFADAPLEQAFYSSNELGGLRIADPFMGGGIPLLEANRVGCAVTGYDINPMAYWVVKQEIEHLDLEAYRKAGRDLRAHLANEIGMLYRTTCVHCGSPDAQVKYFLWVKTQRCKHCGHTCELFPGYLIAKNRRHPKNVFVCAECASLHETDDREDPGVCMSCAQPIAVDGPARRSRYLCAACGAENVFPDADQGPPKHHLFAMEYHCSACRNGHRGRYFKKPDSDDLERYAEAAARLKRLRTKYVPDDEIPTGDETGRLHRWGYRQYREMFNARQLLGLELSARYIAGMPDKRLHDALATNLSDLLRYQNMLCRYDTMALKSLDIFSIHGYPIGLVRCESNILGIVDTRRKTSIGSGGWSNIIDKFAKAKAYCSRPFEIRHNGRRKHVVPIEGEWIGDLRDGADGSEARSVELHCADATKAEFRPRSLDAVFTDPPYFANVQYAELMDFCYVWLRRLARDAPTSFQAPSTRNVAELTANVSMGRTLQHFTEGLSAVFTLMARALKRGGPLAFTYHHNRLEAYYPIAVAILDAGLTCSASIPCPAEMGASIHIKGTGSSIVDSVFVCRSKGSVPRRWVSDSAEEIARMVRDDVRALAPAHQATEGDVRCMVFGHLTRLAVWHLRTSWKAGRSTSSRLASVAGWIESTGGPGAVQQRLDGDVSGAPASLGPLFEVHQPVTPYGEGEALVSF